MLDSARTRVSLPVGVSWPCITVVAEAADGALEDVVHRQCSPARPGKPLVPLALKPESTQGGRHMDSEPMASNASGDRGAERHRVGSKARGRRERVSRDHESSSRAFSFGFPAHLRRPWPLCMRACTVNFQGPCVRGAMAAWCCYMR